MRTPARRKRLVAVVALAALVAAGLLLLLGDGVRQGGPLACVDCASIGDSLPLDVGRDGTTGEAVLLNHGRQDAVLARVTFERLTTGVKILGPLALRLGDKAGPGLAAGLAVGFPPARAQGKARPVRGFVVHPYRSYDEAVELLVGFRPLSEGIHGYRAILIHYHVGGTRYVARYPVSTTVCAPEEKYTGRCPVVDP